MYQPEEAWCKRVHCIRFTLIDDLFYCCRYKRAMGADCAVHIIKFLAAHGVTHVTDPFCGKGTVLAAANAFGISAQGVDVSSKQGTTVVFFLVSS